MSNYNKIIQWISENIQNKEMAATLMRSQMIILGALEILIAHDLMHELDDFIQTTVDGDLEDLIKKINDF